jgi:ABC-type phosphate transport system substrate-binding protein
MHINLTKTSFGLAAIAGILAATGSARADNLGDCSTLNAGKPQVYVTGSSAIKPFIAELAFALKEEQTIIYVSQGSCAGAEAITGEIKIPAADNNADIFINSKAGDKCSVPAGGVVANLGVSDVFADSCSNIGELPDGVKDFQGPIQVMNFVVPIGADASIQSISAEAAYLVYGFDVSSDNPDTGASWADGTPWTVKDSIWARNGSSGTQSMIGKAIGVDPASWPISSYTDGNTVAHNTGSSGGMVAKIGTPTGDIDATIGILASTELDDNRSTIRGLAYQHYGQICGYWPDSTSSSKDKLNVRNGRYAIWGPLHMFTKVDGQGAPESETVADLIGYIDGSKSLDGVDLLALAASKNVVPVCAMEVSRSEELGEYQSVNPSCTCAYLDARGELDEDACKTCDNDDDCTEGNKTTCSYGYCEAL